MANEVKITDIVGKEAIGQLEELDEKIKSTQETYVKFAKKLGDGLKLNPNNLSELSSKIQEYGTNIKTLQSTVTEYNETARKRADIESKLAKAASRVNLILEFIKLFLLLISKERLLFPMIDAYSCIRLDAASCNSLSEGIPEITNAFKFPLYASMNLQRGISSHFVYNFAISKFMLKNIHAYLHRPA